MVYVDAFITPVPKANIEKYKAQAEMSAKVWVDAGAISYSEAFADDAPVGELTSFPRSVQLKDDEVVSFGYAVYESRTKRDEVMKKVFEDARMQEAMKEMTFDGKRMIWGGFQTFVNA